MRNTYWATVEYLLDQHAAIVALTDHTGEWAGAGRIDLRHRAFETDNALRDRLYDAGYHYASATASAKSGRLDRFSVVG